MEVVAGIVRWFADPAHWQGAAGVPQRILEHLLISAGALLVAAAVGLIAGIGVGHTRRWTALAVNAANIGRALPTIAVMAFVLPVTAAIDSQNGFKVYPAVIGLIVLAIPPILVNSYAGISGVEPDIVEAGRAMGMRGRELLWRVEIPLALPVILTGIRSATSQVIATATLAALFGGPGLGRYLVEGYAQRDYPMMFAGVILVGALFLVIEAAFGLAEGLLTPAGVQRRSDPAAIRGPASVRT
jgi:osmoprotectant transport system permease protein